MNENNTDHRYCTHPCHLLRHSECRHRQASALSRCDPAGMRRAPAVVTAVRASYARHHGSAVAHSAQNAELPDRTVSPCLIRSVAYAGVIRRLVSLERLCLYLWHIVRNVLTNGHSRNVYSSIGVRIHNNTEKSVEDYAPSKMANTSALRIG